MESRPLPLAATQEFSGVEQLEFWERLDRKREQLNTEMADFKKAKEQEYRDYEEHLRDQLRAPLRDGETYEDFEERVRIRRHAAQEESMNEDGARAKNNRRKHRQRNTSTALATPPDSQQKEQINGTQSTQNDTVTRSFYGGITSQNDPVLALHDASSTSRSESSPGASAGPPIPASASHDREKEYEGVFTPRFLPLIDTATRSSRSNSDELLEASSLHPKPSSMARAMQTNPTLRHQLSSSAEYHHNPGMTSPPTQPARPLSSSVPAEHDGAGHHRSSSASRASEASLRRSSLRNRNASEPRSPKKVLFNIDNKVVSPSTSPIAKREKEKPRTSKKSVVPETNMYEVVKNKPLKQPAANGAGMLASSLSGVSASATGWTSDVSPLRWAMNGGERKKPSPDDFVNVGDDTDMFSLDEEMKAEEKTAAESNVEGKFGKHADEDEEMEMEGAKPLTGSSPHAGSLPIEIKWPGRRESRDEIQDG